MCWLSLCVMSCATPELLIPQMRVRAVRGTGRFNVTVAAAWTGQASAATAAAPMDAASELHWEDAPCRQRRACETQAAAEARALDAFAARLSFSEDTQ